jgi:hypothetical protein
MGEIMTSYVVVVVAVSAAVVGNRVRIRVRGCSMEGRTERKSIGIRVE